MSDGVQFTKDSARRIARVVRDAEETPFELSKPNRARRVGADNSRVGFINSEAALAEFVIPRGGVVWLKNDSNSDGAYRGYRPEYPALLRYVISSDEVCPGFRGNGWSRGECVVLVDDYATLEVGKRIGPQKDSFAAKEAKLGTMLVLSKHEDLGDGTGYVIARLGLLRVA